MKEKKPQFVKMNASREENPPHREIACPDYRSCLTLAAFKNLCLDCSLCEGGTDLDGAASAGRTIRMPAISGHCVLQSLPA